MSWYVQNAHSIPQIHQSCPYLGTIRNHWVGVALQRFRKWLAAKSIIRRELPGVYPKDVFFIARHVCLLKISNIHKHTIFEADSIDLNNQQNQT